MGQLKDFIKDIIDDAGAGLMVEASVESAADSITGKIEEVATDFLEWYVDRDILPKDDHFSINELWEQFKIERNL